jgi:hypothetical protein
MMPAPAFRKRLALLCGMLGSDHHGERANAAALATKLIREQGLTWEQVIAGSPTTADRSTNHSNPFTDRDDGPDALDKVRTALAYPGRLTERELEFCQSIQLQLRRHRRLSDKQEQVLNRVYGKVRNYDEP